MAKFGVNFGMKSSAKYHSRKISPKAMYGRFVAIRKRQLYTELGLPGERWHEIELEDG